MSKREWLVVGALIFLTLLAFAYSKAQAAVPASVPAGVTQAGAAANVAAGDSETVSGEGFGVGGSY